MSISKRMAAEFLGTFWLVFGGCGSAVLAAAPILPALGGGLVQLEGVRRAAVLHAAAGGDAGRRPRR